MSEHVHSEEHERTPGVSHEGEAFAFRLIIWLGAGLAGIIVGVQFIVSGLLGGLEKHHASPPASVSELAKEDAERPLDQRVESVPAPRLEGIERESGTSRIAAARQLAEEKMKRYGWIDRQKGIVHVPIDKAMEQAVRSKAFGSPRGRDRKRAEDGGRER